MLSLTCFSLRFTFSWTLTLLIIILQIILINLGCWQIHRAHEKQLLLNNYHLQEKTQIKEWNFNQALPLADQVIKINGRYIEPNLLLDNQHYQHQFGYDVISPLLLDNGMVVLIDRGWIIGDTLRQKFQKIFTPKENVGLLGRVYYPSASLWVLGVEIEAKNKQLAIIERINTKNLSLFLHKSLYPFIIRLDEHDVNSFVREWPVVSMSPERHYAYAVQWFVMSLVLFIIYFALSLKKK